MRDFASSLMPSGDRRIAKKQQWGGSVPPPEKHDYKTFWSYQEHPLFCGSLNANRPVEIYRAVNVTI